MEARVIISMLSIYGGWWNDWLMYLDHSIFLCGDLPHKFEAGTPGDWWSGICFWQVAVDYLTVIGMDKIHAYEQELTLLKWIV
jgi:cysteine desulfurase/selenocysteine lyase